MSTTIKPSCKQIKMTTLSQTLEKLIACYPEATVINFTKHKMDIELPANLCWLDVNPKGKTRVNQSQVLTGSLTELDWLVHLDKTTNQKFIILISENKKYTYEQLQYLLDTLSSWAPCIDLLVDKQVKDNPARWPINDLHEALELIDVKDIELTKVPKSWLKRIQYWLGVRTHYQVYHYGSLDF
ncbi:MULTISPECIES: hypothetical protein [unclassified Motilimonas]|uniref:hypothetical protein n=1 Tax=Motilimonas TaxID=1914248 RepID=UPI001E3040CE|nr:MULTISPECIES: hypothetical protein [unclassified Motilimonas]MCE0557937.1 hypothetical protein [Motilimonas sp. E26]MDO6524741.1 hypothetical protein [Motilimonas sp. 1_MG-2023]